MKTKEELIEKWESYKNGARTVADSKAIEYADKFINDLNQLDEPEVKQLCKKIRELESYNDELIRDNNQLRNAMDNQEVLSQELPVIPKFVADVIDLYKKYGMALTTLLTDLAYHGELQVDSINDVTSDTMFDWADENSDMVEEIIARAWLDGYEIEEESKYVIRHKSGGGYYLIEFNLGEESPASYGTEKEEWITFDTKREAELIAEFSEWAGEIERVDTND